MCRVRPDFDPCLILARQPDFIQLIGLIMLEILIILFAHSTN